MKKLIYSWVFHILMNIEDALKVLTQAEKATIISEGKLPKKIRPAHVEFVKKKFSIIGYGRVVSIGMDQIFRNLFDEIKYRETECECEGHKNPYIFDDGIKWADIGTSRLNVLMRCYYCGSEFKQKRNAEQERIANLFLYKPSMEEICWR